MEISGVYVGAYGKKPCPRWNGDWRSRADNGNGTGNAMLPTMGMGGRMLYGTMWEQVMGVEFIMGWEGWERGRSKSRWDSPHAAVPSHSIWELLARLPMNTPGNIVQAAHDLGLSKASHIYP